MTFLRFVAACLFTLLCSIAALAIALAGQPRRAWLFARQRWGRGTLRLIGVQVDVHGAEHLAGPAVFVSNHASVLDIVVLPAILPRETTLVAKKEIGHIPIFGWAFRRSGGITVDRKNAVAAMASIAAGVKHLPPGWSVAVFPEGTRSRDGHLQPFKKGAFHVAMHAHLPVVPIGIDGGVALMPKGTWVPRAGRMAVTVGAPISTQDWQRETLNEHVGHVRDAVSRCLDASRARLVS